jgi:hypothetical protein
MIKVENVEVFNFEGAIRGMRNPLNSWDKSDTEYEYAYGVCHTVKIGENDLDLMRRLYRAGADGNFAHRKFLRQIMVSMDITAPLYWWKEFDTYKVGTTSNSCSTMHKIHDKEFTLDDFSHEHLFGDEYEKDIDEPLGALKYIIDMLNEWRDEYLLSKDKDVWWQMIQLLPTSFNQKRTITMNYENAVNIIKQRTGHKLDEWNEFCEVLKDLPDIKEIMEG